MTPAPSLPPKARPPLRALAEASAAGAVYLVLACLLYWPATPFGTGHLPGCACGDPEQQTWFLAWTSHALTHGLNPFFTHYLNTPRGANLAIDTAMPLLGVLGTPITLLAGPVATFNLLLKLGLAASGASMFWVLRRYTSWWPAAFGGGLLFAFSPYLAGQGVRHVFLSFVPLVPLFIPLLDDWLVSRRRSPLRSGMLLGLVAALQYLISPEILLTSTIMAAAGLVWLALRHPRAAGERAGALARGVVTALPVFVLIAGYAMWLLIAGPDRPAGPVHILSGLARYHADLLSPLLPTSHQLLAPGALAAAGDRLPAGATIENGFYLGLPLLVLLCYFAIRYRRVPLVAIATVIGLAAFILGLGAKLTVNGTAIGIPLPFAVFTHLPILQNLEPARLSLYVQLAAAVIVAAGLDRARAHGWGRASAAAGHGRPAAGQGQPSPVGALVPATVPATGKGLGQPPVPRPGPAGVPASGDPGSPGRGEGPPARRHAGWSRSAVVVAVGLVALLPIVPELPIHTHLIHTLRFFTSTKVREVPPGAVALTFPFELAPRNDAMMWQAASGMRFRVLGGDVFVPGAGGRSTWHPLPQGPPVLAQVLKAGQYTNTPPPPMTASAVAAIRELCARSHVAAVFVDRKALYGHLFDLLVHRALRMPGRAEGRLSVWLHVQRDLHRHPG
ncbi:MAG TPA: hypothetical protein VFJ07_12305 [Streptosporangiaceae bacterium]|nr:hypothetical protein [Streptosporangiaceae bacterium]